VSAKVYREEIILTENGEEFQVETYGELHLLPRNARSAFAIFGMFERTSDGHLLYSMSADDMDISACDSHYLDDLRALKSGNFEITEHL